MDLPEEEEKSTSFHLASHNEAKPAAKGKGLLAKAKEKKDAKKRKASADLWLAVDPIAPPKKSRGPPKDRSRS